MKDRIKLFIALYAIALLCSTLSSGSYAAAKTYNWKLAHTRSPESQLHKDMLEFAEKVKAGTDGCLNISIMGSGQLGNWSIAQERVAMGNFEMTMSPVASAVDKRLECVILPAGIRDWKTAVEKFVVGSPFMDLVFSWAEEQNLTFLAPYPFYLGGLGFTKEIEKPQDPTVKRGRKIRIPEMTSFRHMVEGLGYIPTPVAWTDVFPALQTGVVDGITGGGAEAYYTSGFADVLKAYLPINSHFEVWFMMVNAHKFKALPPDIQYVLKRESVALQNKRLEEGPKETAKWEQSLRDAGVTVYELTDEQIEAYHKIMREASWPAARKIIGEEVFDKVSGLLQ